MALTSITSTSQNGSFELLATELKAPPALANNSGSTITISLTATGQWSLINSQKSDPGLIKYNTPVDGDGYARDKNDEKFAFKYPNLNPAALVGEIKDANGNTKLVVSGKQQSFELQPGDTVSFIANDDVKWYGNNTGKLTIAYSATTKAPQTIPKGRIVVSSDEWTLSNTGFQSSSDAATFILNVAKYFVGEKKGKFHALSTNFGLVESSLEQTLTKAGHTWTKGTNITVDLPTLSRYDAIFLAGDLVDNQVLIQYVKNGGKVYLAAGTGWGGAQPEADRWNTFLREFGLKFAGAYNGISGNLSPNQSHPLFAGVKSLYFNNGNSITDLKPESPLNEIIQTHNAQGLIATAEFDPTAPAVIADLYNTGVDHARQVLGDSIPDPHYTLATYPVGTVTPGVTTPNKDLAPINWVANSQTARWIGPNTPSANGPIGDYSYKTTFTLPGFSEALIVGELSVDDTIIDILLNGVSVGHPVPLSSWTEISRFSISQGFIVGTNTLEFKLNSIGGPTGLRIDCMSGTYKPAVTSANAVLNDLSNKTVFIENLETKRYLFSDGASIKGDRGAEGGWLASSGFESPEVVGADANYYNRAYWKIIPSGEHFLIENLETKRYLFSDGSVITGNRGAEGGWLASSGFASPKVVGADANYYNRALWKIIPTNGGFLIENLETKRYLFSDGNPISGDRGAEGGWLASSGFASPNVVGADANYYNRAIWKIYPA